MGYTKLFNEILASTIWQESNHVRLVWITMLAMKDQHHEVMASVPGLAKMANVTREQCEEALKILCAPDPDSRSQEFEGRRIEKCDGGWRILNGEKFRQKQSKEERKEYQREWVKEKRNKIKDVDSMSTASTKVDNVDTSEQNRTYQNINNKMRMPIVGDSQLPKGQKIWLSAEGMFEGLTESMISRWKKAYPALNIESELAKAAAWIFANPKNKKSNYERYIVNWLSRSQDKAPRVEKSALNSSGSTIDDGEGEWSTIVEHIRRRGTSQRCEGISDRGRKALNSIGGMSFLGMARSDQMPFIKKDFKNAYLTTK